MQLQAHHCLKGKQQMPHKFLTGHFLLNKLTEILRVLEKGSR